MPYYKMFEQSNITILDVRKNILQPIETTQAYDLPASTFIYVVTGEIAIIRAKGCENIKQYAIVHLNKGTLLKLQTLTDDTTYYVILYKIYTPQYKNNIEESPTFFQEYYRIMPTYPPTITELVHNLYGHWQNTSDKERFMALVLFYQFILHVLQDLPQTNLSKHPMTAMVNYITVNYNKPLRIPDIAKQYHYSQRQFLRLFKIHTDQTPQQFITMLRLKKGSEYLLHTTHTVKEIAHLVGYDDEYYFSRTFKKHYKYSPIAYRQKNTVMMANKSMSNSLIQNYDKEDFNFLTEYKMTGSKSMTIKKKQWHGMMALLFSLLLIISGCSTTVSPTTESKTVTTDATIVQTRMIKDDLKREVEVPYEPKRVIVDWNVGDVLAVGIEPVGVSSTVMEYNQMLEPYIPKTAEGIGYEGQVSMEKVVELNPDLIITFNEQAVAEYEKVAPTVLYNTANYKTIEEQVIAMGDILNRQKEAENFITDMNMRLATVKEKIAEVIEPNSTFTIINSKGAKDAVIEIEDGGGSALYELLELQMPNSLQELVKDTNKGRIGLSWETVHEYTGEYIFKMYSGEEDEENEQLPVTWNNLKAVKDHHVIPLTFEKYFMSDPISAILQAEEMGNKLIENATQH